MAKWEYSVVYAQSTTLQGRLREAGQDGWEAACMTEVPDGSGDVTYTLIFKRSL
jgi:hypothetical protein